MRLIFERGTPSRHCHLPPDCGMSAHEIGTGRGRKLNLPELSENETSRYYTGPVGRAHGVNDGFYPLGSYIMKYNPEVNEEAASLGGFAGIHPLQPERTIRGALRVSGLAEKHLYKITGMEAMTFQPAVGVHGKFTGLLLMRTCHHFKGDEKRAKIIAPDFAYGTNLAGAATAGYSVVSIPSREDGCMDLDKLKEAVGEDTTGLVLTNPNTAGLLGKNILEVIRIVHEAGGLCYHDGVNLNTVMGIVRPGDVGFGVIHLNLRKTFPMPHGESGPGSGPVDCEKLLRSFLPGFMVKAPGEEERCGALSFVKEPESIGRVKTFYGNFGVAVKVLSYIMVLGREGIPEVSSNIVLNVNYMMNKLSDLYKVVYNETRMHEFVVTLEDLKHDINVSVTNITKALLDYGIHPPTMHFSPIVRKAPMMEPAETESGETLDQAIGVFRNIYKAAKADPESLHQAPVRTAVRQLDEVTAVRRPVLCYMGE